MYMYIYTYTYILFNHVEYLFFALQEFMGSGVSMKDVGMTPKGRPRMPKIAQGRRGGGGGPRGKRRFSSDDEYYEYSSDNGECL